jgi:hypothetical protein
MTRSADRERLTRRVVLLLMISVLPACMAGNATQPDTKQAAAGGKTFWIYRKGTFYWQGDYSWGVKVDFRDTSGEPIEGRHAIAVTGIGGFQPYAQGNDFDTTPYKYLVFSLKPTIAHQTWDSGFEAVGDVPTGIVVDVLKYGPAPVVGQWGTYKIPLGAGGYQIPFGSHIYKFMIQDQTADQPALGLKTNLWYVDNVALTSE